MNVQAKVNIHNRFDIEVRDAVTGELKQKAEAYNIVLDAMYSRLCAGNSYFYAIFFGTGTGTLSPARTSLFTHLGAKVATNMTQIKAVPQSSWKQYIVLNPEDNVGAVLTEVGIGYSTGSTNLLTHALLKDSEGNPISITKSALDVVTIYATVFVTFDTTGIYFQGVAAGLNQLMNYMIGGAGSPAGTFGLKTELCAKSGGNTPSVTWTADTANKKRTSSVARFDINTGNMHAQAFEFDNTFAAKLPLTGVFDGQPYTGVAIGTGDGSTRQFFVPSLNVRQSTLAIKLDGVVNAAYTKKLFKTMGNSAFKGQDAQVTTYGAYSLAMSTDGLRIVAAGAGNPVNRLATISRASANDVWTYEGQTPDLGMGGLSGIAMNAAGTNLVVLGQSAPYIKVFNYVAGAWVATTAPTLASTHYWSAMSDDGNVIALSSYDSVGIRVFDFNGTTWVERTKAETTISGNGMLALSPDGMSVLYRKTATTLRLATWNGLTWSYRPDASVSSEASGQVAMSADCSVIATFGYGNTTPTTTDVFDWNGSAWVKRPSLPATPAVPSTSPPCGTMSRDGTKIFRGGGTTFATYIIFGYEWYNGAWYAMPTDNKNTNLQGPGRMACSADGSIVAMSCTSVSTTWETLAVYENIHDYTMITFDAAPAAGVAITADYTVDGLHKTNQYVVDCSFSIKFGEGA